MSQCLLRYLKCVLRLSQVSCGVWMCLTGSKHVYAPDPCGCGSSGLRSLAAARPASTACETRVCMQYRSAALTKRWCVGWKRVCVDCVTIYTYTGSTSLAMRATKTRRTPSTTFSREQRFCTLSGVVGGRDIHVAYTDVRVTPYRHWMG